MALIKCPECGAQISDAAKQCVHCGCTFKVCPECGKVHKGDPAVCDSCGYTLREEPKQETPVQTSPAGSAKTKNNCIKLWENESFLRKYHKIFEIVLMLAFLIPTLVLLSLASEMLFSWRDGDPLEGLIKAEETFSSIKMYITISCITFFCALVNEEIWKRYRETSLSNWLTKHHIDPAVAVKEYYATATEKEAIKGELLVKAAYLSITPSAKTREYVISVLSIIFSAAYLLFLGIALVQNIEFYMEQTVILSGEFQLQYKALIPAAVFIVADCVTSTSNRRALKAQQKKWLETVAPGMSNILDN